MARKSDVILTVACAFAFVLAGAGALRRGAPVRKQIDQWLASRATSKALKRHWTEMSSNSPRVGGGTDVRLIEFLDFQCPYCKSESATIDSVLEQNPTLAIGVRQFPLPIHPAAEGAARAALCSEEQ